MPGDMAEINFSSTHFTTLRLDRVLFLPHKCSASAKRNDADAERFRKKFNARKRETSVELKRKYERMVIMWKQEIICIATPDLKHHVYGLRDTAEKRQRFMVVIRMSMLLSLVRWLLRCLAMSLDSASKNSKLSKWRTENRYNRSLSSHDV